MPIESTTTTIIIIPTRTIPTRKGSSSSKMLGMAETLNAFKLFAYNMDLKCNSATNTQKICAPGGERKCEAKREK